MSSTDIPAGFRIDAIPRTIPEEIWSTGCDPFGNTIEALVNEEAQSTPLRCGLKEAAVGEAVGLIAYGPLDQPGPYAEVGPVCLHPTPCDGYQEPRRVPVAFRHRRQVLRVDDSVALSVQSLLALPLILLVVIIRSWPLLHLTPTTTMETAVAAAASLILGLLAARTLRVYARSENGRAATSGSWTYFLWWLGAFAVKATLTVAFGGTATTMRTAELLIPIFFLVLTRNASLYLRAARLGLPLH